MIGSVAFLRFNGVRIIFCNVLLGEKGPADKVASLHGFEPGQFYQIAVYCVHPSNPLFDERSYTLLASCDLAFTRLGGGRGCHWPLF